MTFLDNINWFELREQERALERIKGPSCNEEINQRLEQLKSLIYQIQAHGVNVMGLSERTVYGSSVKPCVILCRKVKCPALQRDPREFIRGSRCTVLDKIPGNMAECPRGLL